jgi:polyribonucleotide 5'-hydroxyl-kinase
LSEWRFEVGHGSTPTNIRLVSGEAERDGTELASNHTYSFSDTKSKILTWTGCTLEVEGPCDEYVAEHATPADTPAASYLNLHFALQSMREAAAAAATATATTASANGPRVLVCGPPNCGKTSLARTLVALATKMGEHPMLVSVDPRDGMLSLPGTLSAAVFASTMDVEDPEGGIGVCATPTNVAAAVPAKLPLVHYFGHRKPEEDMELWRELVDELGKAVEAKMRFDRNVARAGVIVDVPAVAVGQEGIEVIAHAVKAFEGMGCFGVLIRRIMLTSAVNIVVVLGSTGMHADLQRRLGTERTRTGAPISVVPLDKSSGVVDRDANFMQLSREAAIKEYFFGNSKQTLSPSTQTFGFDQIVIYTSADREFLHFYLPNQRVLAQDGLLTIDQLLPNKHPVSLD